jgi:hypothetical protein
MTKRGVAYVCYGAPAVSEAENSMRTLWKYGDLPVLVVGDKEAATHFKGNPKVTVKVPSVEPYYGTQFMAGRVKPLLAGLTPFEQTLYVDADTEFMNTPEHGYRLLERWDVVVAETETRSLLNGIAGAAECQWSSNHYGTPYLAYHNSGMVFWRKNEGTDKLFKLWAEEWQRFSGWDEQAALLRALMRWDGLFLTVPYSWNCREGRKSIFLHHRFGSRSARSGGRPARQRHPMAMMRDMVTVEFMPGKFVRCRPGQEEFMKERLSRPYKITEARRKRAAGKG